MNENVNIFQYLSNTASPCDMKMSGEQQTDPLKLKWLILLKITP
jgi:hypothetical protein